VAWDLATRAFPGRPRRSCFPPGGRSNVLSARGGEPDGLLSYDRWHLAFIGTSFPTIPRPPGILPFGGWRSRVRPFKISSAQAFSSGIDSLIRTCHSRKISLDALNSACNVCDTSSDAASRPQSPGKRFAALLRQVMGSASRARRSTAGSLGTEGYHRYAGRGRDVCQAANEPERASKPEPNCRASGLPEPRAAGDTARRGAFW
jgi:hypothetical protein